MIKNHFILTIGAAALLVAACGDRTSSPAPDNDGQSATEAAVTSPIDTMTFAPELNIDLAQFTRTSTGLYYRDIVVGDGAEVKSGQMVAVYYAGMLANGQLFEAVTPERGPVTFTVGVGKLIDGWDQGIPGMKVGGKRQLIVPAELGYGGRASDRIPANSTLVFTVDVVDAE